MCEVVGLRLKNVEWHPRLGEQLIPMLTAGRAGDRTTQAYDRRLMLRVPDAGRVGHHAVDRSANHPDVEHAEVDAYDATVSEWELDRCLTPI